jgi:hypothetical protein
MTAPSDPKITNGIHHAKRPAKQKKDEHPKKEEQQPIMQFARFFKAYSLGLSLVVAAVPLGMAKWSLIPMFESSKYSLTIITSVGSYLLVGFIFSQRQSIARLYFPGLRPGKEKGRGAVARPGDLRRSRSFSLFIPSALAFVSVLLFFLYLYAVSQAIHSAAYNYSTELPQGTEQAVLLRTKFEPQLAGKVVPARLPFAPDKPILIIHEESKVNDKLESYYDVQFPDEESVHALLAGVPSASIPFARWQSGLFLFAFLCAVSAFVLMGMKDYLQEGLGLSDKELILNPAVGTVRKKFWLEGVPGIYGYMDYCPNDPDVEPLFDGTYCTWHGRLLQTGEFDENTPEVVKVWKHEWVHNKQNVSLPCSAFKQPMSEAELERRFHDSGMSEFHQAVRRVKSLHGQTTTAGAGATEPTAGQSAEGMGRPTEMAAELAAVTQT